MMNCSCSRSIPSLGQGVGIKRGARIRLLYYPEGLVGSEGGATKLLLIEAGLCLLYHDVDENETGRTEMILSLG